MIISRLKPCCYKCDYPDVEVDKRDYWMDDGKSTCILSCAHEKVCKFYKEQEEE